MSKSIGFASRERLRDLYVGRVEKLRMVDELFCNWGLMEFGRISYFRAYGSTFSFLACLIQPGHEISTKKGNDRQIQAGITS